MLWWIFGTPGTSQHKQKHESTSRAKRFPDYLLFYILSSNAPSTSNPIIVDNQEVTMQKKQKNDLQWLLNTTKKKRLAFCESQLSLFASHKS